MTFASIAIRLRRAGLVLVLALLAIGLAPAANAQNSTGQPSAQQSVNTRERPMVGLTDSNDAELLRALRGAQGIVSIPDQKAATLIQPQGRGWRQTMEGTIRELGTWLVLGILAILIAFFLLRGRITIEGGASGRVVQRFNSVSKSSLWIGACGASWPSSFRPTRRCLTWPSGLAILRSRPSTTSTTSLRYSRSLTAWGRCSYHASFNHLVVRASG